MATQPLPEPDLQFHTDRSGNVTVLRCTGRINSATKDDFQQAARALFTDNGVLKIDLTDVVHVDSSGLGAMLSVWLAGKRRQCKVSYINLNKRIEDLLRITKLNEVLKGDEYLGLTPD